MKRVTTTLLVPVAMIVGLALSGCNGSSYNDAGTPGQPPPPVVPTNFTTFTQGQFATSATTETAAPAEVDNLTFSFTDDDNPAAFDVIINTAM